MATMHPSVHSVIAVLAVVAVVAGYAQGIVRRRKGFGDGGQEYGYVDVRDGAHMFYWLYYVNGGDTPADKPLVIWLQGGPGASSTSFGNFEEIGPLDSNLKARNATWVKYVNVMFVDSPVGTGFSYVDSSAKLTTTNKQIAFDLIEMMRGFLKRHPQFRTVPLYVFSESYGGKMAAEFVLGLYKEKKAGTIDVDIQGVALGDAWISPVDTVLAWPDYLLQTGMVDTEGFKAVDRLAQLTQRAVQRGQFAQATQLWSQTEGAIARATHGINFYNILERVSPKTAFRAENNTGGQGRGMVDSRGRRAVLTAANRSVAAVAAGRWAEATRRWEAAEGEVLAAAKHVDFYNILTPVEANQEEPRTEDRDFLFRVMSERIAPDERLDELMNTRVKPVLSVIPERVKFRTTSASVFNALYGDFMKPVTHIVERLLSETDLKVVVFNGQLDLIVSTSGTLRWAERLKWRSGEYWTTKAPRRALAVGGTLEGFVKTAGKFSFYWINRAGHMVPTDNPAAAVEMLRQVTDFDKRETTE